MIEGVLGNLASMGLRRREDRVLLQKRMTMKGMISTMRIRLMMLQKDKLNIKLWSKKKNKRQLVEESMPEGDQGEEVISLVVEDDVQSFPHQL